MLAAEYALGLLGADEARQFEQRLTGDPLLRAEYALWVEDLARMAGSVPAEPVPPAAFRAIEARLFPEERRSILARLGLWQSLAGAAAAGLLVLAVTELGWLATPPEPSLTAQIAAQIAAQDRSLILLARFDPASGALLVERQAGGMAAGRVQELWLIAEGAAPVSLGLVAAAGTTTLTLRADLAAMLGGAVLGGAVLAISDEPPGGSPTGQPTGAVLATGPVRQRM